MAAPNARPSPTANWPNDMYEPGKEDGAVRCLAVGCEVRFSDWGETQAVNGAQLSHYDLFSKPKDEMSNANQNSDISKMQHGILKQMHTLKKCPLCGTTLREDNIHKHDPRKYDTRDIFAHFNTHQREADMLKLLPGFVSLVRKYPGSFADHSPAAIEHRDETFRFTFEHAKLQLTMGTWQRDFSIVVMGRPDLAVPENKLLELLTIPGKTKHFPIHPKDFLSTLKYDPKTAKVPQDEWELLRNGLRVGYDKFGF